tara:strand:- start:894 stop:2801 length:1908 start_codon:yes stop_codon:yes gene_type:complete
MLTNSNFKYLKIEYFLIIVPFFSFLWHFENTHLPISDAVGYLESSYKIYSYFSMGDYPSFIISIFNERDWRPVFFQVLIVPFLIFSAGNILLSVLLTHVFFNTLSAIFIYKILSSYIDKYNSLILTLIFSLSFNVFFGGESLPLFAEIAFIPFLLASLYYMSEKEIFLNKRYAILFTIFFSLTLLVRPIEGILFLIIPFFVLILKKREVIFLNIEIIRGFLFPVFFLWLLFASRLIPKTSESIIKIDPPASLEIFTALFYFFTCILVILLLLYMYKRKDLSIIKKNYLSKILQYSSLVLWVWYTPRFGSLYGWVYQTSIGTQFQYLKNQDHNLFGLVQNIISSNGSLIVFILIIFTVISILNTIKKERFGNNFFKTYFINFKNFISIFLLSILIPTILYFTTHQISYRKISPVILILLIFMVILIFKKTNYKKIYSVIFSIFLFTQSLLLTNHIYNYKNNETWENKNNSYISHLILGNGFPHPINSKSAPYERIIEFLQSFNISGVKSKIAIVLNDNAFPIEPYLLKFLCNQKSFDCYVNSPRNYIENDYSYLSKFDYILLIDSIEFPFIDSSLVADKIDEYIKNNINYISPGALYSYKLQYLLIKKLLPSINLSIKKCDNFHKKNVVCLLEKKN